MKMEIVLDDICDSGLKDYLLSQDGIIDVEVLVKDFFSTLRIDYDETTSPLIIIKYINLYLKIKYPIIVNFDKNSEIKLKSLKYIVEDMCCEWCYKSLVGALFDNQFIKSVNTNFDFDEPAFNIDFVIEYEENLTEEKLIKLIKENQ
ncbi:MAG: hypothetical protein OSJ65_03245 [Bacilli bacterium]|nr:hypothetical protein [Bacilli bacterium]